MNAKIVVFVISAEAIMTVWTCMTVPLKINFMEDLQPLKM